MSLKSGYIHDSAGAEVCTETFQVTCDRGVIVSSTVASDVPVLRRFGCAPDYEFKPVVVDGVPLVVGPDNCPICISMLGYYKIEVPEETEGSIFYEEVDCTKGNFSLPSTGAVSTDPLDKQITTETTWERVSDCAPLKQIICMQGKKINLECWIDLQSSQLIERPDMSDLEFAGAGFTPVPKTLEAEINSFALVGVFTGTIEDAAAAAIAANGPVQFTAPDGQVIDAVPANLCAYKVKAAPCGSVILSDPLDPDTGSEVKVEGTFVNGVQIASAADAPFATTDLTAPVAQVADAYSDWCFQFKLEGTCDKAGVFTPDA